MTNATTKTAKSLRNSALAVIMAGGMFTSLVEAAAIVGTAALVPVAMQMGVGSNHPQSAVAIAHAARLQRAEQA